MSILLNKKTSILVQGITGSEGLFHAQQMLDYGSNVVCGVTPGKGGKTATENNPTNPIQAIYVTNFFIISPYLSSYILY